MTKTDALERLGELKLKLEGLLRAHTQHSLVEMAREARPVLLAGLQQAVEQGHIAKDEAAPLKRMLESQTASTPVVKASRAHIDSGLDDGERTQQDDKLVELIRKSIAMVDAAIAAAVASPGANLVTRADDKSKKPTEPTLTVYTDLKFGI